MSTALNKLMDYLARRDHSELELRQKLRLKFSAEDIDRALQTAKERGWMPAPEELSERVARQLGQKGKGLLYIQQYLKKKGLPAVAADEEAECEKCRKLIAPLLAKEKDFIKLTRYLQNRGYENHIIRKVLDEER